LPERRSRKPTSRNCPRFSGISVPELLKSLSANYRNRCPEIAETRSRACWSVRIRSWGDCRERGKLGPFGATGTGCFNTNACTARLVQFDRYLVVVSSAQRTVKWVVSRIAREALNIDFCATIYPDLAVVRPTVSFTFRAKLEVKHAILYLAGKLVSISAPNAVLFAYFSDYPNSVELVRSHGAGRRKRGNLRFGRSHECTGRKPKNVFFKSSLRPDSFCAFPIVRCTCARIRGVTTDVGAAALSAFPFR